MNREWIASVDQADVLCSLLKSASLVDDVSMSGFTLRFELPNSVAPLFEALDSSSIV